MKTFVIVSLYLFVPCAAGGMATPFLLAARVRKPHLALLAFAIAAWVIVVLVSAAVMLP